MTSIDAYNENLRAADVARASRNKPQPKGLADWQARKQARENDALAPYAVVKDGYEYCVTFEGKGSSVNRFRTKREALEVAQELKQRHDADERRKANGWEYVDIMPDIYRVMASFT